MQTVKHLDTNRYQLTIVAKIATIQTIIDAK